MIISKIKENPVIKKIIVIVAIVLVVANIVSAIVVSESFLSRERILKKEANKIISAELSSEEHMNWLKVKAEKVNLKDMEEVALYLKNKSTSHSYMIILHSLTTKVEDMASYIYHFYDLGFNVYVPEYMGETVSMGIKEQDVVLKWADHIAKVDDKANIFVFGLGMGGTTALLCADNLKHENVKGVISDSGYSDVKEVFKISINNIYGVPSFPTVALSSLYVKITRKLIFKEEDVLEAVRESEVPILYIHGTEDSIVPVQQSNRLYEVTKAKGSDHITIHGAEHGQTMTEDTEKYWREVDAFIRNSLDY